MNFIRKIRERRLRKRLAMRTTYTIAELPLVLRWINGDDSMEEKLFDAWLFRAMGYPRVR